MATHIERVGHKPTCSVRLSSNKSKSDLPLVEQSSKSKLSLFGLTSAVTLLSAFLLSEAANQDSTISKPYNQSREVLVLPTRGNDDTTVQYLEPDDYKREVANRIRKIKGFKAREEYLREVIKLINPELLPTSEDTALSQFNKNTDYSLICTGIKKDPFRFVFINDFSGKNSEPIRISFSLEEIMETKNMSQDEIVELLQNKVDKLKEIRSEQFQIWKDFYEFDLPKNNGASMVTLVLANLEGMETDLAKALEEYHTIYGMSVEAICIDPVHREKLDIALSQFGLNNMPIYSNATKADILRQLENTITRAIDDKKTTVMVHFMSHGGDSGKMWASDGPILPEEVAQVLTKSYRGDKSKPLCGEIEINIWYGTCYSGRPLDYIRKYFEDRKDLPVKGLRIIAESKYTTTGAGTTPDNASLVSDRMTDKSGPLDYYRSWYREQLAHLESKGIKVSNPVDTFLHEIRFADLMSWYDTSNNQDSQGFYYFNDPTNRRSDNRIFTEFRKNDDSVKI